MLETTWRARGSLQALNSRIIEALGAPLLQYQLLDPPAVGCPDHVHRGEEPRQVGGKGTNVQHSPDETTEHSSEFIKNQVSSEFINATIVMNNVSEAESGGCSNFSSATKTTLTLPPQRLSNSNEYSRQCRVHNHPPESVPWALQAICIVIRTPAGPAKPRACCGSVVQYVPSPKAVGALTGDRD